MRQSSGLELQPLEEMAGKGYHMRRLVVVVVVEEESVAEGQLRRAGELGGGGVESLAAGRRK